MLTTNRCWLNYILNHPSYQTCSHIYFSASFFLICVGFLQSWSMENWRTQDRDIPWLFIMKHLASSSMHRALLFVIFYTDLPFYGSTFSFLDFFLRLEEVRSCVYSSNVWYRGKGPIPLYLGLGLVSFISTWRRSEVHKLWSIPTLRKTQKGKKNIHVDLPCVTSTHIYLV